jgi:hypothetical protein
MQFFLESLWRDQVISDETKTNKLNFMRSRIKMLDDSLYETCLKRVYEDSIEPGNDPKKIKHEHQTFVWQQ